MVFSSIRQSVPIKQFMAWHLVLLLAVSAALSGGVTSLRSAAIMVLAYIAADLLWTYASRRVWYYPLSSIISGLILGLVAPSNLPLWLAIALPMVAVGAKHCLHFGRIRHVVNPAAFSLGVLSLFLPVASWWGPSGGAYPFYLVLAGGLFTVWHQRRWDTVGPYLLTYLIGVALLVVTAGGELSLSFVRQQLLDGTLLFFVSVMLIDPLTSSFPARRARVLFGVAAAASGIIIMALVRFLPFSVDPLIWGLIIANLIFNLRYLPMRPIQQGSV
jgi:Na+-translocating ferredoxin:NAD+ oxidoreductase RnfD subunit